MTNYRYYEYVNGVEHYFEWQNATEGGIVFDMVEVRSGGGYRHTPMLAYDLNAIQSPSVQSMYFSYWGQQMGTVYRDTYYDVFGVHSNIAGDDTAFGYDVQLNYTTYGSDTAAMLHAIRDYFDSQSSQGQGTVTLDISANGQTLKFASSLLGKTINQFISSDAEVNFDGETVGITLEGGKGDEVAIYDGSTLLQTVTFGSNATTANASIPLNKAITFTSTKFKYGDDNTYFSKTVTVTTVGETVKVMPDGALYWYGNECTDVTGGWSIHNVEHHTYNGSAYSVLTAPLTKNKNSIYVGWDSEDLAQVPTTYYYSSSLSTNNAVSYTHSTAKVKIKHSEAVKEVSDNRYGVLGGCGYNTANSGNTYWNINWGTSLDYPSEVAGENVRTNLYLSGSDSSTNVYFSVFVSVFKNSPARQYQNIEIEYFVLDE